MPKFSDNYYERKCYLKGTDVPTQSIMKKKMSPSLANVYFKSMTPKLKVLAGLEPPMKGGGNDWYVPPDDILAGRAVMKPIKNEFLSKLCFNGIDYFGEKLVEQHHKSMEEEKRRFLLENDAKWKRKIDIACQQKWDETSKESAHNNTVRIQYAFREFQSLFTTSITRIEAVLFDAAIKEIENVKQAAYEKMKLKFEKMVKYQAITKYDQYTKILNKEKERLKKRFIENIKKTQIDTARQLHDINVEKHTAVEKMRLFIECQNLACQAYVALKEKQECKKEMDKSEYEHKKKIKKLDDKIAMQDFEIKLCKEKEMKRKEFKKLWHRKVCHVVKYLQEFIAYCLHTMPNNAEFFINIEKLMLLQLSEAMDNPSVESFFVPEEDTFHVPIPKPHPFYIFCDKGFKPKLDQDLCPKHCTSSASQLPVVVINKKFIYTACDNIDMFTDKMKEFIEGERGDDKDFVDDHDYTHDIPYHFSDSQQLLELKLESSIMQILQNELPNARQHTLECCFCKVPYCFCSPLHASEILGRKKFPSELLQPVKKIPSGDKITSREMELVHFREPKLDSYLKYVEPQKCACGKRAKKHLEEHLPPYMRKISPFEPIKLPHYETCSVETLRELVKNARGIKPPIPIQIVESKTKDVCTQYSDSAFVNLCTCFSDEEIERLYKNLLTGITVNLDPSPKTDIVDGSVSPSYLLKRSSSFALKQAYSLRRLLDNSPELQELFMKTNCKY